MSTPFFTRSLLQNRRARFGLALVLLLTVLATLAPVLTPYSPVEQLDLANKQLSSPSLHHPLGTDFYSRDLMTRVLFGTRTSLSIAFLSILVSVTIGTAVGLIAGYTGGITDTLLMRGVDAGLAIPRVFLLLVILTLWEHVSQLGLVVVLGLTSWLGTSRIVRAEVLYMRSRDFVVAARSIGVGKLRIILRHLLPNAIGPVTVAATLGMGHMILIEAGLSYLGVGIRPPTASLGRMIGDGWEHIRDAPWISVFPGLVIVITVIGFSLIGDGMRDAADPQSK